MVRSISGRFGCFFFVRGGKPHVVAPSGDRLAHNIATLPYFTSPSSERPTHDASVPLSITSPSLEAVSFDMLAQQFVSEDVACQGPAPVADMAHVNVSQRAEPDGLCDGVIPSSPSSFFQDHAFSRFSLRERRKLYMGHTAPTRTKHEG
jgi:hypothetical protein